MSLRAALLLLVLFAISMLRGPSVGAKWMDLEVTLEPESATIGDRLTLTVVLTHAAESLVTGPTERDAFLPLELIEALPPQASGGAAELQKTRFVYILTAFQTGEIQPPELEYRASDGSSEVVPLPVVTIESVLPAEGVPELRDVRGPVQAAGPPRWPWAVLLMAGFAGLTAITMLLIRPAVVRPSLPPAPVRAEVPEVAARRELEAIGAAGLLERADLTEYYSRIAGCLREYLSGRFEIPAAAMTPEELERRLEALEVDPWPVRLAVNLLQQCEAAQFAQYQPARERAAADLATAFEIVELTAEREEAVVS